MAIILSLSKDVLLPRRSVVDRSFAWATGFRRLFKDDERSASTLADLRLRLPHTQKMLLY
ncbi:transposase [Methylobacterium sp. RAS18]|nr:transposase [Methylobacterium sp. RAS18]